MKLEEWSRDWLLLFHPDKCKILTIGRHEDIPCAYPYSLFGTELEHIFEEKDIGITIDSELTFDTHIALKIKKANQTMGLIRRVFSHMGKEMFLRLYPAFVRSHLEFSQVVWAPWRRAQIRRIEAVQERATRMVEGLGHLDYTERLKALKLTTLSYRRLRGDMIEIWKHINTYSDGTRPMNFKLVQRPIRSTCHPHQLYPPTAKDGHTGVQSNNFYFRVAATWNALPVDVVTAETLNSFKNRLDSHWSNNQLKYMTVAGDSVNEDS